MANAWWDMKVEDVLKAYELLVQAEKKSYVITEMI